MILRVRPALTVLFDPGCSRLCDMCHSFLNATTTCEYCGRFAVCTGCARFGDPFRRHREGECKRWLALPEKIRSQPKLDVLWLLIRYRAALAEHEEGWRGGTLSNMSATAGEELSRPTSSKEPPHEPQELDLPIEAERESGLASNLNYSGHDDIPRESIAGLAVLQANDAVVPPEQLQRFAALADLSPSTVLQLIMKARLTDSVRHAPPLNLQSFRWCSCVHCTHLKSY